MKHTLTELMFFPAIFKQLAVQSPSQTAVCGDAFDLTYEELDTLSDTLAGQLEVFRGQPVAICFPKSVECYLAQIAVMKAGAFFVPIDPGYPRERISHMLGDSGVKVVLTLPGTEFPGPDSIDIVTVDIESLRSSDDKGSLTFPDVHPDDLAYMIYTSGSTGKPKGVPIHYEAMANHNDWCSKAYELTPEDRVLQFASISFDISIEEIFPTLLSGATLFSGPGDGFDSLGDFFSWVEANRITVLNLPTAFWHEVVHYLPYKPLPRSVRLMVIGGEKVNGTAVTQWFEHVSDEVALINAYGPTEATITSSIVHLRKGRDISIGKPIDGLLYEVWDEHQKRVQEGAEGELIISGIGLTKGYWKQPKATERQFVTRNGVRYYRTGDKVVKDSESDYLYLGRIDDQVKIRGFRIEPNEVSETIETHPLIDQSIVRPLSANGNTELVAYYRKKPDGEITSKELEALLKETLPAFMVPAYWVEIDEVPMSPSGKIDYSKLPQPSSTVIDTGAPAPTLPVEKKIAEIWKSVLAVEDINLNTNFFECGGNSIKALRLLSTLEKQCGGVRIPISALIEYPTLDWFCRLVDSGEWFDQNAKPGDPAITILNSESTEIPIVAFHGAGGSALMFREFDKALTEKHPFYIVESSLLNGSGPVTIPQKNVSEIVANYASHLIPQISGKTVILAGYSFGGILSYEMARVLSEKGFIVSKLILIDSPNPSVVTTVNPIHRLGRTGYLLLTDIQLFIEKARYALMIRNRRAQALLDDESNACQSRAVQIEDLFNQIEDEFRPFPYKGDLVLIAADQPNISTKWPDDYGWPRLLPPGAFRKFVVAGNHLSMVTPGNLENIIDIFKGIVESEPLEPALPGKHSPGKFCLLIAGVLFGAGVFGILNSTTTLSISFLIGAWLMVSLGCVLAAVNN